MKLEFTREDDYIGMHGRWASEQHYKIGVKKDGTITAVSLDAVTNMGAYRKQSGNLSGTDFYNIPNFKKVIKAGAHQYRRRRQLSRAGLSAVGFRLCVVSWIRSPTKWVSTRYDMFMRNRSAKIQKQDCLSHRIIWNSASSKAPSGSAGAKNGTNLAPWAA